jgi:hypothetical protein
MNTRTITNLFNKVLLHNCLFPEVKYEFVGFTGIDNGTNRIPYVEVIFKQQLVDETVPATPNEIANFMQSLNFRKVNHTSFSNTQYIVFDLFPRNVLKDNNGNIYVVDSEFSDKTNDKENTLNEMLFDLFDKRNVLKTNYLNEFHRHSIEKKMKQIEQWNESPFNLEIALFRQRNREQLAAEMDVI